MSKALEAAAREMARQQYPTLDWSGMDASDREGFCSEVARIIRAFAANVTDDDFENNDDLTERVESIVVNEGLSALYRAAILEALK